MHKESILPRRTILVLLLVVMALVIPSAAQAAAQNAPSKVALGNEQSSMVNSSENRISAASKGKWIEVDLSSQRVYARQGNRIVRKMVVSTGLARYPTPTGRFRIYAKYRSVRMTGPGYNLPNVPHTMYFYRGYALHGTYWHHNFGRRMSHGCVNLKRKDAAWLYKWAPRGTLVVIHR
jgi:lipoprotein-anchoring transpeptidase ErfK/SrfK